MVDSDYRLKLLKEYSDNVCNHCNTNDFRVVSSDLYDNLYDNITTMKVECTTCNRLYSVRFG